MPFHKGARYFYTLNRGLQQQSVLYTTVGLWKIPTLALDPNALSTNGSLAVAGYVASRDGAKLAYGTSPGEARIGQSGTSGTWLPARTCPTCCAGQSITSRCLLLTARASITAVFQRRLREKNSAHAIWATQFTTMPCTLQSSDRKLYERTDHPDWQFEPHLTQDGRWLVLSAGEGEVGDKGLMNVYASDLNSANPAMVSLAEGFDAAYLYAGAAHGLLDIFDDAGCAPWSRHRDQPHNPRAGTLEGRSELQGADSMAVAARNVTLIADQLIVRTLHEHTSSRHLWDRRALAARGGTARPWRGIWIRRRA